MEAYIQTAIGIGVSVLLFLLGYRQTIGAKKERAKNANLSVHRAVMRRMVLEGYSPKYKDVSRILEGKAREFQVSVNDLLSEDQVLNSLYTEVFDSDLISPDQRKEIESRLDSLFQKIEEEPNKPTFSQISEMRAEKKESKETVWVMALAASMMGATISVLYRFLKEPVAIDSEFLISGLGILVASIAIVSTISTIRRSKDIEVNVSKRSVQVRSALFELEIAKAIEKANIPYKSEPSINNLRPDFVLEVGPENIVVEAKAWDDIVPLNRIKTVMDYLHKLTEMEQVDRAILVTKKRPPIKGLDSDSGKIQILSQSEFNNFLKKNAA